MDEPKKLILEDDKIRAMEMYGTAKAFRYLNKHVRELLGLPYLSREIEIGDTTISVSNIEGEIDQTRIRRRRPPVPEEEEKEIGRGGLGVIACGHPESGKVYFRSESAGMNFFIDVKEIEGGSNIAVFYLISGLYDCFDIGCICYRIAWPNIKVLKYRVTSFDRKISVTWTHPPYNVLYPDQTPTPDTSRYFKAIVESQIVEIVSQDPYFTTPTTYGSRSAYGGFSVTTLNHGPISQQDGHSYCEPRVCVVWYDGSGSPATFLDKIKFHLLGVMQWIEQIVGTMHGADSTLSWIHLRWFYHEGATSYWFVLPDPNEANLEVLVTGADGSPAHYIYGIGSGDYVNDGIGVAWIILRETSWDWWSNLHYEQLINEMHVYPVLNKTFKGIRGYTHLYATHEADFSTPEDTRIVSERTRTVYSLNTPSYILKKMTYRRSHSFWETDYAADWTVWFLSRGRPDIRNPWGGGIEGRFSCCDQWPGLKVDPYGDSAKVSGYDLLKGIYEIDIEDTPTLFGIEDGSSPPVAEIIPPKYFKKPYIFGQVNTMGGGRELLAPKNFDVLTYVPVCLLIPNPPPVDDLPPGDSLDYDFTTKGRKLNARNGFPYKMISWQRVPFAENFGIWPSTVAANKDKRFL